MTPPIVTIEQGKVKGKTAVDYLGGSYFSFQGIPYGKAPVGDLRFKAPLPAESWEDVRDATKEGPECPSTHMFFKYFVGSEDNCLNLNVYTRELPKNGKNILKPVMVWIHGGAFIYGSNKTELYAPDYLMTEDIVLVVINYRLGVLGFLSLEDTSLGVPGNAGFKDMVLALKWVQKNISSFMGDPHNVTIFGESAGAASVHYLVLSPLAKGLFHKAIAQSGCAINCWAKGASNGKKIAEYLQYNETDEKKILEYLRKEAPQKLVKAQLKVPDDFCACNIRYFGPVVEKPSNEPAFLSEDPIKILKSGSFNKVPIIMGYNSEEGLFFELVCKVRPDIRSKIIFEREIKPEFNLVQGSEKSLELGEKIKEFYFGKTEPSENLDRVYMLKTDTQFVHDIYRSVNYHKLSTAPVYFYKMSLETSLNYFKKMCATKSITAIFLLYYFCFKTGDYNAARNIFLKLTNAVPGKTLSGVAHADDLGYLFKSFMSVKFEPNSIEDISVKRFVKMWTNFARTGNPTPNPTDELLKVNWKPVEKDQLNYLHLDEKLQCEVNPNDERSKFWDEMYSKFASS